MLAGVRQPEALDKKIIQIHGGQLDQRLDKVLHDNRRKKYGTVGQFRPSLPRLFPAAGVDVDLAEVVHK
jgi:hypothetical protein